MKNKFKLFNTFYINEINIKVYYFGCKSKIDKPLGKNVFCDFNDHSIYIYLDTKTIESNLKNMNFWMFYVKYYLKEFNKHKDYLFFNINANKIMLLGKIIQLQYIPLNTNLSSYSLDDEKLKIYIYKKYLLDSKKLKNIFCKIYCQILEHQFKDFFNEVKNEILKFQSDLKINWYQTKFINSFYGKNRFNKKTHEANIIFNGLLTFYPPIFIKQVILHEFAHCFYQNHSKNFHTIYKKMLIKYECENFEIKKTKYNNLIIDCIV